jgi:hemerythrin-like domain-containing protein
MNPRAATEQLRVDHRRIETHLDRLLAALQQLSPERVADVRIEFAEIRRLAEPHFRKEEEVFYPRLRPEVPALLGRMDEQHAHTRLTERCLGELLDSLSGPASDRDLTELYRLGIEFHDAVQTHIVDEEDVLLKWADGVLCDEAQDRLWREMQQAAEA